MSGNFVSPKIYPWGHSQSEIYALKFEFQRLRRYGFLTFKIKDQSFDDTASLSVYSEFIRSVARGNVWRVRSGDHGGQFCGQPRPIHLSENSFRYSVSYRIKCWVSRHSESASVIMFFVVHDARVTPMFCARFRSPWIWNLQNSIATENQTYGNDTYNRERSQK
jgi:hypothetical protein